MTKELPKEFVFRDPTRTREEQQYVYKQLTGDSGSGATVGDFKSRVAAVGPQAGYFFKLGDQKWHANLKGSRVRRQEPAGRLERVAHAGDPAGFREKIIE